MKKILLIVVALFLLVSCKQTATIDPEVNSVYYEIYVGSFYDSDGDGSGDLNGVTQKLDYIQELGATGIWLMPIHPSPTYHKYDVTDYYGIDEAYGTMDDFDKLITEMEKRDMDLIIDLVLNHSSSQHPWFTSAVDAYQNDDCDTVKYCEYYHFSDEFEPGYASNGNIYYEAVFWEGMPDLNLDSEQLRNEIEEIAHFWLDKGVHGFRLDATTHFYREKTPENVAFLQWFNRTVKDYQKEAYIVGEAWTGDSIVSKMYESQIDSFFNFTMSQQGGRIAQSINLQTGLALANYVKEYQSKIESYSASAINAVFLSNHDNDRSAGYLADDKQKMAASIYLLMPGNVFIYYGEEIGMRGSGIDENKRLPMVWSFDDTLTNPPQMANYEFDQPNSVEQALKDEESLLKHYQTILKARNTYSETIARGDFEVLEVDKTVYALDYGDLIVMHHLSQDSLTIDLEYKDVEVLFGEVDNKSNQLTLNGYTTLIIHR